MGGHCAVICLFFVPYSPAFSLAPASGLHSEPSSTTHSVCTDFPPQFLAPLCQGPLPRFFGDLMKLLALSGLKG